MRIHKRTNYEKGADKERRVVNRARNEGKITFRSAGSHSPIDVCIIDRQNKKIEFVQCKPLNFGIKAKFDLEYEYKDLNDEFMVTFRVE